jgi:hypothetical protein
MTTISEYAKSYEAEQTKNIADLEEVPTTLDLEDDEFKAIDEKTGKEKVVKQKVITLNGEKYRVPNSVIIQLKALLEDSPNLTKFRVKKSGEGMNTRYMVIPKA